MRAYSAVAASSSSIDRRVEALDGAEHDLVVLDVHHDDLAGVEFLVEEALAQRILDVVLQSTAQRPGSELRVVPGTGQPLLGGIGELQAQALCPKLVRGALDHQIDDLHHLVDAQFVEDDGVVDAVQELRAGSAP